jgi:sugar lactone lactonase YvrE
MSRLIPELVLDARAIVGESPVWDAVRGVLWWVDIPRGIVHSFNPKSGLDQTFPAGPTVGSVALCTDGNILVAAQSEVGILEPETRRWKPIINFADDASAHRSNDGKCDPAGRFWLGRMAIDAAPGRGSLSRIEQNCIITTMIEGLTIPNGMAWSLDFKRMYFVDSPQRAVVEYPYDVESGEIGSNRCLIQFADPTALPGMTIDSEGAIWVAMWGGSCVLRISPAGQVIDRIDLPVSQVASCTFAGDDLFDLYITTAREDFSAADIKREPTSGGLFRLRTGVCGTLPALFSGFQNE